MIKYFLDYLTEISDVNTSQQPKYTPEHQRRWRLNWINLIHCFIARFDYDHIKEESLENYKAEQNVRVKICLEPDKMYEYVTVN